MTSPIKNHLQSQQEDNVNAISVLAHFLLVGSMLSIWWYLLEPSGWSFWISGVGALLCVTSYALAYRKDYRSMKQGRWLNIAKLWGFTGALFGYLALKFSNEGGFARETSVLWPMAAVCIALAVVAVLAEGFIPSIKDKENLTDAITEEMIG